MKKIKNYSIRRNNIRYIFLKLGIFTSIFLGIISFINQSSLNLLTSNVLYDGKISKVKLYDNIDKLSFNGTTWPVKEITDLSYQTIKNSGLSYSKLRQINWNDVPESLKTFFPTKVGDYIKKYQNITLQTCWNIFSNSQELNKFTFMRRIIRATWTASYNSKLIWKKGSGTHAGIDIIGNTGTPVYSIANGIVIEIKHSNNGFGNFIGILHKVDNKYYMSIYGHMYSINNKLKIGSIVNKGDLIGKLGHSGNSVGSHLHLQINKIFTLQDILNKRASIGWYHNLDGVKAYTVDPIVFVEKYYKSVGDNFKENNKGELDNEIKKVSVTKKNVKKIGEKEESKDKLDLVKTISSVLEKEHPVAPIKSISYIKDVKLSLVDNKVQLGHGFTINLSIFTGKGNISIVPSNENLSFFPDIIQNPDKTNYNINVLARKVGNTKIKISDGKTIREYNVNIYNDNSNKIFGIKVVSSGLNLLLENKIDIYPTNKFGQILNQKISGLFKIYVEQNGDKHLLKKLQINSNKGEIYIKGYFIGKGKLIVSSDKYYSKQNIITNISKDYKFTDKYSDDIFDLIKHNIVNGDNGKLFPNRKITRRELLTILGRSILKVDYKKTKIDMFNYIKTKGKFFKDIDGKAYSDPYVYIAWEKGIIKGENKWSLANNNVSKAELLTIYSRLFKLSVSLDKLNVWTDLKLNNKLKAIADTCKKYGLYPFKNYEKFNAGELVTRLVAFETLKRFIDVSSISTTHLSASIPEKNGSDEDLKKTMSDIFNF